MSIVMTGLIRFIVIFLLVYLLISLFTRYIFPFILRLFFSRMGKRYRERYDRRSGNKTKKEGEVKIDYVPRRSKKIDKDSGEYIDYEELDE